MNHDAKWFERRPNEYERGATHLSGLERIAAIKKAEKAAKNLVTKDKSDLPAEQLKSWTEVQESPSIMATPPNQVGFAWLDLDGWTAKDA